MLVDLNDFSVGEIDFIIRLARERCEEILLSNDPLVVSNIAQTIATLELARAVQQGHTRTCDGINHVVDALQGTD